MTNSGLQNGTARTQRARRYLGEVAPALVLLGLVSLLWTAYHRLWTEESWKIPISYQGDALWGLATAKAIASGDIKPFLGKQPQSLGAPFGANWSDYPSVEEGLIAVWGLLADALGLFAGSNIIVLLAHVLAALAFYFVCRELAYDRIFSMAGAILFAFSHYAFFRGLPHLTLTYYWHIPWGLLVAYWCLRGDDFALDRRKLLLALFTAIAFGGQNPYYSGMFFQMLGGSALLRLIRTRSWRSTVVPIILGAVTLATFLLMNADTFYYRLVHGPNPAAVVRRYGEVELFALKPIELFLPRWHSVTALQDWARRSYYEQSWLIGEGGSPYLGIIGISALVALLALVVKRVASDAPRRLPLHFWAILWFAAFSIPGGVNGLLGSTGMILFRSSNRYSIFVFAVLLLYLVRELSRWTARWHPTLRLGSAALLVGIGFYDQVPPRAWQQSAEITQRELGIDKRVVRWLETALPKSAMVFQLPVCDFPEGGSVVVLDSSELFRPYLHARSLRFSFGSGKGRPRERWQKETEQLRPLEMIQQLERYGFAAILIHRRGYVDGGAALEEALQAHGAEFLGRAPGYVALRLHPTTPAALPPDSASGVTRP